MTIAQQLEQKGIKKGIEKGMQLGEHKSRIDIAEKLLKNGMAFNLVKEMTGLSEEELAKIRH